MGRRRIATCLKWRRGQLERTNVSESLAGYSGRFPQLGDPLSLSSPQSYGRIVAGRLLAGEGFHDASANRDHGVTRHRLDGRLAVRV